MPENAQRLKVLKTYKLFIGGAFPRTESGRYLRAHAVKSGEHLANYCHASRKDVRDSVVAARKAFPRWSGAGTSAYLRGQVLYRLAEMLEGRAAAVAKELSVSTGCPPSRAEREVAAAVDRLVYFAGWSDKYHQVFGNVNPVSSSHFNFSVPEPTGVVGIICPDRPCLLALVGLVSEVIVTGNTAVVLTSEQYPLPPLTFAETIVTSDVPGGVVNLLTGKRAELAETFATHMDINALVDASGDGSVATVLQAGAATNLKRVHTRALAERAWFSGAGQDPYRIMDCTETKTAWHPIGY